MGITVKAELRYGYNLGDDESGWEFAEVSDDEYSTTPTVDWWNEDGDGLSEQAEVMLLASVGFTETDWRADGYWDRKRAAQNLLAVEFESTGYEGGRTLLVAKGREYHAYSSDCTELDPAAMGAAADEVANKALANALQVLGITPNQTKPMWLLTCYYG